MDGQATGNSSVNRRSIPLRGEDGAIAARVLMHDTHYCRKKLKEHSAKTVTDTNQDQENAIAFKVSWILRAVSRNSTVSTHSS